MTNDLYCMTKPILGRLPKWIPLDFTRFFIKNALLIPFCFNCKEPIIFVSLRPSKLN
jgi:hypothetical protein